MSANKMLIDATHPEETRVVVLKQGRVEEFDYESAARKQLRGNIYLAKVTRVEPSLQAAFVEYGGNRHGFLAFSEIHPDYYQIPMADRQALLEQEALAEAEQAAQDDADVEDVVVIDDADDAVDNEDDDIEDVADDDIVSSNSDLDDDDDGDDDIGETDADSADVETSQSASEPEASEDEPVDDAIAAEEPRDEAADDENDASDTNDKGDSSNTAALAADTGDAISAPLAEDNDNDDDESADAVAASDTSSSDADTLEDGDDDIDTDSAGNDEDEDQAPEDVSANDSLDEVPARPRRRARIYKIQEVIKRRQVILVQVVKEERGNKGAALTTYLSLAGRYTVLMPNTARGGGISRKITNPQDRKRLKSIANELDVPEGMGLIVRTAGASRTKQELRRDFEYLLRLWESVRDLTLESSAPSLVYEEGNLIKRSIRDLYNKDVDEVLVAGAKAYKQAKDFMRMLMPSHAKNVVQHQESESLFTRYGIERQLNAMFSPQVTLRSGGYLIINQTEALVAIDVNSGKATREFSIEETALATNLEAASEIARQLKLRDLAGLVVIDFIDMDERRNNRAVERRLKEALRHDRARIQFGRISHFGLLEMSRQRLRTGVLEGSTSQCPHCQGTGIIRSTDSVALAVLRAIEDAAVTGEHGSIVAVTSPEAAIYILNNKRAFLNEIESAHGISVAVEASDKMQGANFTVGKVVDGGGTGSGSDKTVVNMDWGFEPEPQPQENSNGRRRGRRGRGRGQNEDAGANGDEQKTRRRRRRRGRRGDRDGQDNDVNQANGRDATDQQDNSIPGDGPQPDIDTGAPREATRDSAVETDNNDGDETQASTRKPRRRRGRRGGNAERRGRSRTRAAETGEEAVTPDAGDDTVTPVTGAHDGSENESTSASTSEAPPQSEPAIDSAPDRERAPSPPEPAVAEAADVNHESRTAETEQAEPPQQKEKPRRSTTSSAPKLERVQLTPDETTEADVAAKAEEQSTRRGWWNRKLGRS